MSWQWPVADPVVVTSPFALARLNPVTGKVQPHTGTDFRARQGAPLFAAHAGRVIRATWTDLTGNYVRIEVAPNLWIGYSHLSRLDVRVGQQLDAGHVIGAAGSTGSATAAHLHFEVCVDGVKVDPVPFLSARVARPPVPLPPVPQPMKGKEMLIALDNLGRGRILYGDATWSFIAEAATFEQLKAAGVPAVAGKLSAQGTADVFRGGQRK